MSKTVFSSNELKSKSRLYRFYLVLKTFLVLIVFIISFLIAKDHETSSFLRKNHSFDIEGYKKAALVKGVPPEMVHQTVIDNTGGSIGNILRVGFLTLLFFIPSWIVLKVLNRVIMFIALGYQPIDGEKEK